MCHIMSKKDNVYVFNIAGIEAPSIDTWPLHDALNIIRPLYCDLVWRPEH
jgi:hypothetical protein